MGEGCVSRDGVVKWRGRGSSSQTAAVAAVAAVASDGTGLSCGKQRMGREGCWLQFEFWRWKWQWELAADGWRLRLVCEVVVVQCSGLVVVVVVVVVVAVVVVRGWD